MKKNFSFGFQIFCRWCP